METTSRVLPVTAAALEQQVSRLLTKYGRRPEKVLLLRAALSGNGLSSVTIGSRTVHFASCVSPLEVLEKITAHTEGGTDELLVILTAADAADLGPGLLTRAIRQRVFPVEPWQVVEESFGAQSRDPRLSLEPWAAEALIDAMPPGGWPPLAGSVLTRDGALQALAARRLRLDRFGITPDNIDGQALLRWSLDRAAVHEFQQLRQAERTGLVGWLGEIAGRVEQVLFPLVDSGHHSDALPLALVCGAVWHPQAGPEAARSQGGIDTYLKTAGANVGDATIRAFAEAGEQLVRWLLRSDSIEHQALAHDVLNQAESFLDRFGASAIAGHSLLLKSGLRVRVTAVGAALSAALANSGAIPSVREAISALDQHHLSAEHPERKRRAEMAQRLLQWLATDPATEVTGFAAGLDAHIDHWGWVDRACDDIWDGEAEDRALQTAYQRICSAVRDKRRGLDASFARALARSGGQGAELTVETLLEQIVAPIVAGRRRPVLFLVLDGMSAAVAAALGEQLREALWAEYDPAGTGEPRRRAVAAAFPTITRVSRASLLSARLTSGGSDAERQAFESRGFWKRTPMRLFHKSGVLGGAGESLGTELTEALDDTDTAVAVVLNTIDDDLDKGRADTTWKISNIAGLKSLLDYARLQGRAVIITSDHGHVLERATVYRDVPDSGSGRHRAGTAPAADGEVEIMGPRVMADDGRIVALWDAGLRYGPRKAGYHGGASLAEVTIPLLAFLPFGAEPPKDWRALPIQEPAWWSLESASSREAPAATAPAKQSAPKVPKQRRPESLFDIPQDAAPATLVDRLLATELFGIQHKGTARRLDLEKIKAALTALQEAHWHLPLPALAQEIGYPTVRANGFAATLGQILNVDNYPVLQVLDNGRSVKLDVALLKEQFGLKE